MQDLNSDRDRLFRMNAYRQIITSLLIGTPSLAALFIFGDSWSKLQTVTFGSITGVVLLFAIQVNSNKHREMLNKLSNKQGPKP